jgi:hypothetical protein
MKYLAIAALVMLPQMALADGVQIEGNVQAKCIIRTDRTGVYGNPAAEKLSTLPADGGVSPVVRYDVAIPNYYIARISYPSAFSTSPALADTVTWTGGVSVSSVSNSAMSAYEAAKVEYDTTTEFNLAVAGTTWFKINSTAEYGYNKAFPAGTYRAIIQADCIAK